MNTTLDSSAKDKKVLVAIHRSSIIFHVLIVLVLAGLATNFFTEYQLGGFNGYAIKHLVLFSIVLILSVIWKLKWMTTSLLFIIMIYINIIPSTIYLPFRIADVNLNFEAYFSRMEMIVFVMDLLLAVFEKPWHQFVVMGYNTIFIIACAMLYPDLPIGKYILTFLMILSVGAVSSKVIRLQNELQEQHQLVSVQSEELLELTSFGKDIMKMIAHDLRTPIHQISMLPTIIGSSDSKTDRNNYLAIRNLITNAIKFSPQNQRILVDNMEDENHFSLRVHNRAGAINKEKLSKINTGQMVTSSLSTKKEKGCGEGLFICKRTLKNNNASLQLSKSKTGVLVEIQIFKSIPILWFGCCSVIIFFIECPLRHLKGKIKRLIDFHCFARY